MMALLKTDRFNFDNLKLIPMERRRGPAMEPDGGVRDTRTIAIIYDAPFGNHPYMFFDDIEQETLGM